MLPIHATQSLQDIALNFTKTGLLRNTIANIESMYHNYQGQHLLLAILLTLASYLRELVLITSW